MARGNRRPEFLCHFESPALRHLALTGLTDLPVMRAHQAPGAWM